MSQAKIWYVVVDGKAEGPRTEDEIREGIQKHTLSYTDLVFKPGLSRWVTIAECEEFERRMEENAPIHSPTVATLEIPAPDDLTNEGWILLVKQTNADGKNHYIQSGPYTLEQAKKRLTRGDVKYTDHAWKTGFKSWQVINTVTEFERRDEGQNEAPKPEPAKITEPKKEVKVEVLPEVKPEMKPKIRFASSVPVKADEMATVVGTLAKSNAKIVKTSGFQEVEMNDDGDDDGGDKATVVQRPKPSIPKSSPKEILKGPPKQVLEEHIFEDEDEDSDSEKKSSSKKTRFNKKKLMIASMGATLGMALTYAAMNAYNEGLEKESDRGDRRKVASVHIPMVPAPINTGVQAGVQTPNSNVAKAVDPEMENRQPKRSTVLKIVSLKLNSDHPQAVLESDLPGGSIIDVHIMARSGSILKYPSFEMTKKVAVTDGQLPSIDFTNDKLPQGDYALTVKSGALESSAPFSIGDHNGDFQKRLTVFRAQVALQRRKEKAGLDDGLKFVTRSYSSLTREYRKARSTSSQEAKKRWSTMLRSWRKDFDRQSSLLKNVDEKNHNYFVFPDALMKLRAVELQLSDVTQLYDKSLKTGRSIASEDDMDHIFLEHVKDLKATVRRIK